MVIKQKTAKKRKKTHRKAVSAGKGGNPAADGMVGASGAIAVATPRPEDGIKAADRAGGRVDLPTTGGKAGRKRTRGAARKKVRAVRAKARRREKQPLAVGQVRALGLTAATITEAEAGLGDLGRPLAAVLAEWPRLQEAWDRGRFLRNLQALAGTPLTISEAAASLKLEGKELRELLDSDPEAADLWNQARIATRIEIKNAMMERAKGGNPAAAKQVEDLLRQEIVRPAADFAHVTIGQLVELTGKTRQAIHDWHIKYGLSRNSDKTYNLMEFLAWFEDFTLRKRAPGSAAGPVDPLKAVKTEKLEIELSRQRGELLDRGEVMAGTIARHQNLVNGLARKAEELAMLCHNQPIPKIAEILNGFFDELRRQQCQVPEELRLPERIAGQFLELLQQMDPEGQGGTV